MHTTSGSVYWFTGLSGAGKTTLGKLYVEYLKSVNKCNVVLLDGDIMRVVLSSTKNYSSKERNELAFKYSRLSKMLATQGFEVVVCTISMFHNVRKWNRENIESYVEIFIEVPLQNLVERDSKGIYKRKENGGVSDVVGIDLEPELPLDPDLRILNDGSRPLVDLLKDIIRHTKYIHS